MDLTCFIRLFDFESVKVKMKMNYQASFSNKEKENFRGWWCVVGGTELIFFLLGCNEYARLGSALHSPRPREKKASSYFGG